MADLWKHTALLVTGMQREFIEEGFVLCLSGAKAIVPTVIKALGLARQRGILIIWAVREHDPQGRDVECFRRHFYGSGKPNPAVKGSKGVELADGFEMKEGDYKLVKTRYSNSKCVRQTVFDAVALDYHSVTVLVDATAAAAPEVHSANIFDTKKVGVLAKTVEEWRESDA